jgi:hypothetical protein
MINDLDRTDTGAIVQRCAAPFAPSSHGGGRQQSEQCAPHRELSHIDSRSCINHKGGIMDYFEFPGELYERLEREVHENEAAMRNIQERRAIACEVKADDWRHEERALIVAGGMAQGRIKLARELQEYIGEEFDE